MGLLYRRSTVTMQKQLFSTVISPKIFFPKTKGFFMCLIFSHLSINCSIKNHLETLPGERSQGWMLGYVAGFLKLCTIYHEWFFSVTVRNTSFFVLLPGFSLTDPQGSGLSISQAPLFILLSTFWVLFCPEVLTHCPFLSS